MQKAKQKLKNLDFTSENAHIALVGKSQGGPANGKDFALIMKSADQEMITKMQQVQVTFELPDFLRTMFDMYYEDAKVLAGVLGYVEPESEQGSSYQDYIDQKVASITVLKALKDSKDIDADIALMKPEQYLQVLQDQEMLEKAFKQVEEQKILLKAKEGLTEALDKTKETVGKSKGKPSNKKMEKSMDEDTKVAPEVEMIEKSVFVSVEKALADKQVELQKALDELNAFKEAKKQELIKSKSDKITSIVKDEKIAKPLIKAALELDSEDDFTAFVAAVDAMMKTVANAPMFVEQGVSSGQDEGKQIPAIERAIQKKYSK